METRRRFQEVYGQRSEEKDYGSMENLANAHREYLKVVRRQNREAALRRIDQSMQYVSCFEMIKIYKIKIFLLLVSNVFFKV